MFVTVPAGAPEVGTTNPGVPAWAPLDDVVADVVAAAAAAVGVVAVGEEDKEEDGGYVEVLPLGSETKHP